ncbi:MAG: PLP-dependent aminotransferase family protein [Reyranellaceae bacterium]
MNATTAWLPEIHSTDEPMYLALANSFADAIERGTLPTGTQLPPQRDLAKQLGVTVGTVSRAYRLMKKRRLIVGNVGRGTFVSSNHPAAPRAGARTDPSPGRPVNLVSYRSLAPKLNELVAHAMAEAGRRTNLRPAHKYPPAAGMLSHRAEAAQWLKQFGLEAAAEQVVVCGGAQMAIAAVLDGLVEHHKPIMTETLTYSGLRGLCALRNIRLTGLEMDDHGLVPEALEAACKTRGSRVLFVQPTLHNPTAASMPLARRRQIAEIAIQNNLLVIEDDASALTAIDRPPPIATLAPDHTVYITSISKGISPALRLGYMFLPRAMIGKMERAMHSMSLGVSPLAPDVMSVLLANGSVDDILRANIDEMQRRHAIAAETLKPIDYRYQPGAFFLWLPLQGHWRASEFASAALRHDVGVIASDHFKTNRDFPLEAVRLSLAGPADDHSLRQGLQTVARLLRHQPEAWTDVV